jgi:hypothetical protein
MEKLDVEASRTELMRPFHPFMTYKLGTLSLFVGDHSTEIHYNWDMSHLT